MWLEHIAVAKQWNQKEIIEQVALYLSNWYCWRNLTGFPGTPELDRMFVGFVDKLSSEIKDGTINDTKTLISSSIQLLRKKAQKKAECENMLLEPIYSENAKATRFILNRIEEAHTTKEKLNPWGVNDKGKDELSIEHVLPQSKNLNSDWIDMLANGNLESALDIQEKYVHYLGNLTLSAYNANLSNKSFIEKRDHKDNSGNYIGYKNGFYLNCGLKTNLAKCETWNKKLIDDRTEELAAEAMKVLDIWS